MSCIYQSPYNNQPGPAPVTNMSAPKSVDKFACNLVDGIHSQSRAELNSQFPTASVYPYPALIVSQDVKRDTHNTYIHNYRNAHETLVYNNDTECTAPFAIKNLNAPTLQAGYAKNIDLDSELKRINHITDKCFYDNYKFHPDEAPVGNGLYCNKKYLVNDYTSMGKVNCNTGNERQRSVITPAQMQRPIPAEPYESDNTVSFGKISANNTARCRQTVAEPQTCGAFGQFDKCTKSVPDNAKSLLNYKASIAGNVTQHYNFNGDIYNTDKYINDYPCQRLFNNVTKRKMLPNLHNTFDINPCPK